MHQWLYFLIWNIEKYWNAIQYETGTIHHPYIKTPCICPAGSILSEICRAKCMSIYFQAKTSLLMSQIVCHGIHLWRYLQYALFHTSHDELVTRCSSSTLRIC